MESELHELVQGFRGDVHLYAKNLTTGDIIDINGDSTHQSASEAKFYILLSYARLVSNRALDPKRRITIKEEAFFLDRAYYDLNFQAMRFHCHFSPT